MILAPLWLLLRRLWRCETREARNFWLVGWLALCWWISWAIIKLS